MFVGKNVFRSSVSSGQPSVENGHSAELNQVSNVSGSCTKFVLPHFEHFSGLLISTFISPQSLQYYAGIWWPHQI